MFATTFSPAATIDASGLPTRSPLQTLRNWGWKTGKAMQMAQMLRALSHLSDAQLEKIGVTRADVPSYAHRIIYQNG